MRARFIGAPYRLKHPNQGGTAERFVETGRNTGNLLIGDALVRQLDVEITGFGPGGDYDEIRANNDLVVVPSANFLHSGFDMGWIADFIEGVDLPVLMVGLGAQAPNFDGMPKLQDGTVRMLRAVAERTKSIGVRGSFTAEVLEHLGIRNATITGCPSLFRGLQSEINLRPMPTDRLPRMVINGSRNVIGHSFSVPHAAAVESQLIRLSFERNIPYVLQNEEPEMYFVTNEEEAAHLDGLAEIIANFKLPFDKHQFASHLKRNGRIFFDVVAWENFIRDFDLSIGSRFHGNLIALSQGVRSVVIVHDSRTREMCELMKIPHVSIMEVETLDPTEIANRADYSGFQTQYARLYDNYVDFLNSNGAPHRLVRRERPSSAPITRGGRIDMSPQ